MDLNTGPEPQRPSFLRSFMPFWAALVISCVMLARDFHQRNAPLIRFSADVTIEGKLPDQGVAIWIGDHRFDPGMPVPVGLRKVEVGSPGAISDAHYHWIWYGLNTLGAIDLERKRGALRVVVQPPAEKVTVTGKYASRTVLLTTNEYDLGVLPVGKYSIAAEWGKVKEEQEKQLSPNDTNLVIIVGLVGSLELSAEQSGAEFVLQTERGETVAQGSLPQTFPYLASDRYRLQTSRGEYRKEQVVEVKTGATNSVKVRFDYGEVQIASEPPGAAVIFRGKEVGVTPYQSGKLIPAAYEYGIHKEGFEPYELRIAVEGSTTNAAEVKLVNSRYLAGKQMGESFYQNGKFADAERAFQDALNIVPDDAAVARMLQRAKSANYRQQAIVFSDKGQFEEALQRIKNAADVLPGDLENERTRQIILKEQRDASIREVQKQIDYWVSESRKALAAGNFDQADRTLHQAELLRPDDQSFATIRSELQRAQMEAATAKRAREIEARRRQAEPAFVRSLADEPEANLFQTVLWHVTKPSAEVRSACVRMGNAHKEWKVVEKGDSDAYEASLKMGALIPLVKIGYYTRVHAFQISENETEIRAKVFAYIVGGPNRVQSFYDQTFAFLKQELTRELGTELK